MHNVILKIKCSIKKILLKILYKDSLFFKNDLMFRNGFFVKILGGKVVIGKGCFFNNYCSINSLKYIEIGDNCIFGEGVRIYDHNHKYEKNKLIKDSGYNTDEIIIGNNVWIGSNSVILKGVKIGTNVVIGANSIIYKNIPDNSRVISQSDLIIKEI